MCKEKKNYDESSLKEMVGTIVEFVVSQTLMSGCAGTGGGVHFENLAYAHNFSAELFVLELSEFEIMYTDKDIKDLMVMDKTIYVEKAFVERYYTDVLNNDIKTLILLARKLVCSYFDYYNYSWISTVNCVKETKNSLMQKFFMLKFCGLLTFTDFVSRKEIIDAFEKSNDALYFMYKNYAAGFMKQYKISYTCANIYRDHFMECSLFERLDKIEGNDKIFFELSSKGLNCNNALERSGNSRSPKKARVYDVAKKRFVTSNATTVKDFKQEVGLLKELGSF